MSACVASRRRPWACRMRVCVAAALPPALRAPLLHNATRRVQVQHKRNANAKWAVRGAGLFGKGQVLALEATRAVRRGEPLAMDFGPDVLDSTVLLDRGVVDERQPKVPLKALELALTLMLACMTWAGEGVRPAGEGEGSSPLPR